VGKYEVTGCHSRPLTPVSSMTIYNKVHIVKISNAMGVIN